MARTWRRARPACHPAPAPAQTRQTARPAGCSLQRVWAGARTHTRTRGGGQGGAEQRSKKAGVGCVRQGSGTVHGVAGWAMGNRWARGGAPGICMRYVRSGVSVRIGMAGSAWRAVPLTGGGGARPGSAPLAVVTGGGNIGVELRPSCRRGGGPPAVELACRRRPAAEPVPATTPPPAALPLLTSAAVLKLDRVCKVGCGAGVPARSRAVLVVPHELCVDVDA